MDPKIVFIICGAGAIAVLLFCAVLLLRSRERRLSNLFRAELADLRASQSAEIEDLRSAMDEQQPSPEPDFTSEASWTVSPAGAHVLLGDRIAAFLEAGEETGTIATLIGVQKAEVDFVVRVRNLTRGPADLAAG